MRTLIIILLPTLNRQVQFRHDWHSIAVRQHQADFAALAVAGAEVVRRAPR